VGGDIVMWGGTAKVAYFNIYSVIIGGIKGICDENVLGFDVGMDDAARVEGLNAK
jgi:hypothetical protein